MTSPIRDSLRRLHDDEDGMETLQAVMIAGIAAIILLTIVLFWGKIKKWWKSRVEPVPGELEGL